MVKLSLELPVCSGVDGNGSELSSRDSLGLFLLLCVLSEIGA
jgi:hypothetical protein